MRMNTKSQAANGKTVRIKNLTAAIRPVCALNRLLLAILPRWALADAAEHRYWDNLKKLEILFDAQ